MQRAVIIALLAISGPTTAVAGISGCSTDLQVRFIEGAPVDRFVVSNVSDRDYAVSEVVFDLTRSKGQLIFDTESGGAGVEVFQPFVSEGTKVDVPDGATGLRVPMDGLAAGAEVSFTIDVDDQLTRSELGQIRVSGSEMAETRVTFMVGTIPFHASFDDQNVATCKS